MSDLGGLTVVIPVFNEERSIGDTLASVSRVLQQSGIQYEIIAVNDGSIDNSKKILDQYQGDHFKIVEHNRNLGYGASLKSGILNSQFDIIAITDADGTYPFDRIPEFLSEMRDNHMVVGARTGLNVHIPLIRRPAKYFLNKLANYLTNARIPDLNSGLRLFRKKEVIRFLKILPDGFSFTTTITLAMLTNNKNVKFIPIDYLKRKGKSKIRPVRDTLNFIQLIIRTIIYFNPLKIFIPLSLILFLVSMLVLLYSIFFMNKILDTTVVVLLMSALQILAIGMLADLIDKRLL